MRLNWFAGDGVAYTRLLLPLLRQQAEVTVWVTEADRGRELEALAAVRLFRPGEVPWAEVNRADATVYHLDGDTAALARQHPGIVLLHQDAAVERALAVLTHSRAAFERHKADAHLPVVFTPSPLEHPESAAECAAAVLRLAAEAGRYQAQLLAHELAGRAAGELAAWMNAATGRPDLRHLAQAIHEVTAGAA
jgi:hypothetical protein